MSPHVPAGQTWQTSMSVPPSVVENMPLGHLKQPDTCPAPIAGLNDPAGHCVQLGSRIPYLPVGHAAGLHADNPVSSVYPSLHMEQDSNEWSPRPSP